MTIVPIDKKRSALIDTLPFGWAEGMTDEEIYVVYMGEQIDAEAVLKKHGKMWKRIKRFRGKK